MSDPFKPTPRVIELLGYIEKGWVMGAKWSIPRLHRGYTILVAGYGSGIRNPNQNEIIHLMVYNLADEVPTPGNHDTYDTTDPKNHVLVATGMKMVLKPHGQRLLNEARDGAGKGSRSAPRPKAKRTKAR